MFLNGTKRGRVPQVAHDPDLSYCVTGHKNPGSAHSSVLQIWAPSYGFIGKTRLGADHPKPIWPCNQEVNESYSNTEKRKKKKNHSSIGV